jgi:hypothetical protein
LCWARAEDLVLNAIITDQHYCAGDTDGKGRSHERIPQRPCEVSRT